jgi:hypothetical protein
VSHPAALFAFEGDFQTDLRCIPMVVRHRLDEVGIKLSLKEWVKLGPEARAAVLAKVHDEGFDAAVRGLVTQRMGAPPADFAVDPAPAWADRGRVPDEVTAKASAEGLAISAQQWAALAPLQRFALYKLSRSSHKNENFGPACREFGVLDVHDVMEGA